jgi:hypothetical protein
MPEIPGEYVNFSTFLFMSTLTCLPRRRKATKNPVLCDLVAIK